VKARRKELDRLVGGLCRRHARSLTSIRARVRCATAVFDRELFEVRNIAAGYDQPALLRDLAAVLKVT